MMLFKRPLAFLFPFIFFLPLFAFANLEYTLLEPLPGITAAGQTYSTYLIGIFKLAIGVAGILAVVRIVWCGFIMLTATSPSAREEAKKCISAAIFGLLLALGSYAILNTFTDASGISSLLNTTVRDVTVDPVVAGAGVPLNTTPTCSFASSGSGVINIGQTINVLVTCVPSSLTIVWVRQPVGASAVLALNGGPVSFAAAGTYIYEVQGRDPVTNVLGPVDRLTIVVQTTAPPLPPLPPPPSSNPPVINITSPTSGASLDAKNIQINFTASDATELTSITINVSKIEADGSKTTVNSTTACQKVVVGAPAADPPPPPCNANITSTLSLDLSELINILNPATEHDYIIEATACNAAAVCVDAPLVPVVIPDTCVSFPHLECTMLTMPAAPASGAMCAPAFGSISIPQRYDTHVFPFRLEAGQRASVVVRNRPRERCDAGFFTFVREADPATLWCSNNGLLEPDNAFSSGGCRYIRDDRLVIGISKMPGDTAAGPDAGASLDPDRITLNALEKVTGYCGTPVDSTGETGFRTTLITSGVPGPGECLVEAGSYYYVNVAAEGPQPPSPRDQFGIVFGILP